MMKKIIVMLLVLCAALLGGCSEQNNTNQPAKADKIAAAQQKPAQNISFIVYRAAADGSEKLLPEKITLWGSLPLRPARRMLRSRVESISGTSLLKNQIH